LVGWKSRKFKLILIQKVVFGEIEETDADSMKVLKELETFGSSSGSTSKKCFIEDCGEIIE
jgi:hypothetical protein